MTRSDRSRAFLLVAALLAGALALASACGAGGKAARADRDAALLMATDAYELHLLEGKVYQLVMSDDGSTVERREVTDYRRFRELYRVRSGDALPASPTPGDVRVSGWREDLTCVRDGYLCGDEPDPQLTEPAVIILQVRWP